MHILVTNDDGIQAPGLKALALELRNLGTVKVLAPDRNWSASGHVKTLSRPLRVKAVELGDGLDAHACDGAPSDCTALALMGLFPEKFDLVVSGINPHANLGYDVFYSGTVAAAMEGCIFGVPSVAVSLDSPEYYHGNLDFSAAAWAACQVIEQSMTLKGRSGFVLNINVPYLPREELRGFCSTRMGQRIYQDRLVQREDPWGGPYYWIGGEAPSGMSEDGTDIGELAKGYVSITPLHPEMSDHKVLGELAAIRWG